MYDRNERYDGGRLPRRDSGEKKIEAFLKSDNESLELRLYSSEVRRLERDYPVSIEKRNFYDATIKLYNCVVTRR